MLDGASTIDMSHNFLALGCMSLKLSVFEDQKSPGSSDLGVATDGCSWPTETA